MEWRTETSFVNAKFDFSDKDLLKLRGCVSHIYFITGYNNRGLHSKTALCYNHTLISLYLNNNWYMNCHSVNFLIKASLCNAAIIHSQVIASRNWMQYVTKVISLVIIPGFFFLATESLSCDLQPLALSSVSYLVWHTCIRLLHAQTYSLPPSCTLHPAISLTDW